MRRGNLIWGIIIIIVGVLLLLDNLNILPPSINIWTLIWPVVLILMGIWFLLGPRLWGNRVAETRQLAIPLEGARRAELVVEHGAGRLDIRAGVMDLHLVEGSFGGGVNSEVRRDGDYLYARLRPDLDLAFGWWAAGTGGYDWRFTVSPGVDLKLVLKTGAGESVVDLSGLRVTDLRIETGASSTNLVLPANAGLTRAEISAGAASVEMRVPPGVAARIKTETGISSVDVDTTRFPRSGDIYLSPDYDSAPNRLDLHVEAGVGSIRVS